MFVLLSIHIQGMKFYSLNISLLLLLYGTGNSNFLIHVALNMELSRSLVNSGHLFALTSHTQSTHYELVYYSSVCFLMNHFFDFSGTYMQKDIFHYCLVSC